MTNLTAFQVEIMNAVVAGLEQKLPALVEAAVSAAIARSPSLAMNDMGMTIAQYAERTGQTEGAIRKSVARGTLPARRLGRSVRIFLRDVEAARR